MTDEEVEEYLKSIGGLEYAWKENTFITDSSFFECSSGWNKIICSCIKELIDIGWNKKICQIKEKFGGLRFYTDTHTDQEWEIIRKYEDLSYHTCETCGTHENVETKGPGWIQSLCKDCRDEQTKKKESQNN